MSHVRLRTVRLLNGLPSNREMALQGLRVLNGAPTQPFANRITRERVPAAGESLVSGDQGRIMGTMIDLDFQGREWENLLDLQDWHNQRGFNDIGVDFD